MGWSSTAPGVIDAILAAWQAAPGLAGVTVYDGPQPTASGLQEAMVVGYTDEQTPDAVDGTSDIEGVAVGPTREQYTVQCAALVRNGAGDITAARERAYALASAAGATLTADPTLGALVLNAHIGTHALRQTQDQSGALATLLLGVAVDAYSA